MDIKVNGHEYFYDITSTAMLFFPGEKINYVKRSGAKLRARTQLKQNGDKFISVSTVFYDGKYYSVKKSVKGITDTKNLVKQTFYMALSKATGIVSPWGILTGIRPLSVYMRHLSNDEKPEEILKKEYYLKDEKISLLSK